MIIKNITHSILLQKGKIIKFLLKNLAENKSFFKPLNARINSFEQVNFLLHYITLCVNT